MKKTAFLLCLTISWLVTQGQTTIDQSPYGQFIWTQTVRLEACNSDGTVRAAADELSIAKQKFTVIKYSGDYAILVIGVYAAPALQQKFNFIGGNPLQIAYFRCNRTDLTQFSVKDNRIGGSLAVGVINFPFKYRIQKNLNDFTGSFNFGAALGYQFPNKSWNKWSYTVLTAYSISNIILDSASVNDNYLRLVSTNSYTAFSFAIGGMIQYDRVQVGIFIGWDNLSFSTQKTFGWKYQGKPWISVGFGYSIFSIGRTSEAADSKQTP